jgi:N,N'-diacetyllegionaminate synthase
MVDVIKIGERYVGAGHPCFIIAEAGVNHNGDLDLAFRLVDAAVASGADAVKFQTFTTEKVISRLAPKAEYQLRTTEVEESQFDMVKGLELPLEAFQDLKAYCNKRGIIFLSSPFDEDSVDLLAGLGVAAFKVPSGEITNLPYLTRIAEYGKPMIVSTGMSYLSEVETAVQTIEKAGNRQYVLLHCVSNYPAEPANINLRAMHTLSRAFDMPSGYSDHTRGIEVPLAAVAMGACVVEKHFTTDRNLPGPDQLASLEPTELTAMVQGIRIVESALGNGRKEPADSEANTAAVARKSLVAARDIPANTKLTEELIAIKRPGTGLPPIERENLLGRTTLVDIPEDSLLAWEMLV